MNTNQQAGGFGVNVVTDSLVINDSITTSGDGGVFTDLAGTANIAAAGDIDSTGVVTLDAAGGITSGGDITQPMTTSISTTP